MGARATLEGVGSTLGIVTDPLARMAGLPSAREGFSSVADMAGLPKAEAPMERIGAGATEALAGGGGIMGLGRSLATRAPGIGQAAGVDSDREPLVLDEGIGRAGAAQGARQVTLEGDALPLPDPFMVVATQNPMLRERFSGKGPPDFSVLAEPHRAVADLQLPVYITTNYDNFMLAALQRDSSLTNVELARRVHLSPPAVGLNGKTRAARRTNG